MPRNRTIKDPVRYKTVLCEKWEEHGACPYNERCQFAHGKHELRERVDKKKSTGGERTNGAAHAPTATEEQIMCVECTNEAAHTSRPLHPAPPALTLPAALEMPSSATGEKRTAQRSTQLPPGLGVTKVVSWAENPAVVVAEASSPVNSPSGPPPSPATPPLRLRPRHQTKRAWAENESPVQPPHLPKRVWAENESPQQLTADALVTSATAEAQLRCSEGRGEPWVRGNNSMGVRSKVEIDPWTGKIGVSRMGSFTTDSVRRQLSLLFADETDDIPPAPTSNQLWQHDHFGNASLVAPHATAAE